ncbi:iron-sulfur cluster biosynthesis family protein [Halobacillus litoralis]|uniref:iron-sulfur cluster biosynthesis family protein n=1 Tax=Halobacillus litoralis TaxID=45668 RepID=UPI002490B781|nr:iron-sulfur cluster biosynthesis family protein [Halobacillus litoralis]
MKITEEAKQTLEKLIEENGAEGLRIQSVSGGCCGPQIGLSLEAAKESDYIQEINDIRVAIDQQVKGLVDEITLDKKEDQFVLVGLDNCC